MKKNFLMLLLGGAMLMPTTMMAQPDPDDQDPGQHRSPAHNSFVYIAYDDNSSMVNVVILTAVPDVEIIIYLNGTEVDGLMLDAEEGTQIPIYLPTYGSGEFTIQVRSGSTLLATYCTTL